jgi:hypothetical protein
MLGTPSALAAGVYRVDEDHDAGWHRQSTTESICGSGTPTGSQTFEPGPAGAPTEERPRPAPPRGTGSLEFRTGSEGRTIERFRNTRYAGKKIGDISTLSYWTYVDPASSPAVPVTPDPDNPNPDPDSLFPFQVAVSIVLRISETGDGTHINTLTYEPAYQGEVRRGEWQHWDAASPMAKWYLGNDQRVENMKSLDKWTFEGKATIVNDASAPALGGVMLSAGCGTPDPWANFIGNTDEFIIGFGTDITTYDMEPFVPSNQAEHLDCSPETADNPTGVTHIITCNATNSLGRPPQETTIVAEITGANDPDGGDTPASPDLSCTTDDQGTCRLTHSATTHFGSTLYRAWIDEDGQDSTVEADLDEEQPEGSKPGSTPEGEDGDNTDVVAKHWSASKLDCEPETVTLPLGSSHTVTCTATDASGAFVPDTFIDVEATGVNDPDGVSSNSPVSVDFGCKTNEEGSCTFTHGPDGRGTTTVAGRTLYRAWIDVDDRNSTTSEADSSEGRDPATSPGDRPEPDQTDVVEANWSSTATTASPGPTCFTPLPTPTGASPSPTPGGTPCPSATSTPTPTPTPTSSATPGPTSTPTPAGRPDDRLRRGPCKGYLPDSRSPRPGGGEVIVGTGGPDELSGGGGDDLICGLGGKDRLRGMRGYDSAFGGSAADVSFGGNGWDSLSGGNGNDDLHGGLGRDHLDGGPGQDSCTGGTGRNRLVRCE